MGQKILRALLLVAICVFALIVATWLLGLVGIVIPQTILIVIGIIIAICIVSYVLYGTWA